MPTVSRHLPAQPDLAIPKREARELLAQCQAGRPDALARLRDRHPEFHATRDTAGVTDKPIRLTDAQFVLAREYGFSNWAELERRIESAPHSLLLKRAIHADDRGGVFALLRAHPHLLHVPVWSGNWGPPMSHAANLGRLEIVQAAAQLGARDFQHAFDRAILQGKLECARWLQSQGAKPTVDSVLGACECLNPEGLRLLAELGAPFANKHGDRLAPLATLLGTYGRAPARKHACLEILRERGCDFPDTPIMALHRGRIDLLAAHLERDPHLLQRRFALEEIYPAQLGMPDSGDAGMHWTPIAGGTLLHLAVDFAEQEIFPWLLSRGADANAPTTLAADGSGGHTPLFNCVVCGVSRSPTMTRALLAHGASPTHRATLRKFLDWCEEPRWHEARHVTAREWGETFPARDWVNTEAIQLLADAEPSPSPSG